MTTAIGPQREAVAEAMIHNVAKVGTILDIGCGTGRLLARLRDVNPGLELLGVDGSDYNIAEALAAGHEVRRCRIEDELPLATAAVTLVHAADQLTRLTDPDRFLEECRRILAPNGHLLVTAPNLLAWHARLLMLVGLPPLQVEFSSRSNLIGAGRLRRFRRSRPAEGAMRVMTLDAMRDLLNGAGFTVVHVAGAAIDGAPPWLDRTDSFIARVRPRLASQIVILARKGTAG